MVLATHKKLTTLLALGLSVTLLFGGTFAWQSLNQEALNYVTGGANPGGRLHDDFHNVTEELGLSVKTFDKDVYVENFNSVSDEGVNIYARIRLDEYLEWGAGAGTGTNVKTLITGATFADRSTWTTFIPNAESVVALNPLSATQDQINSAKFRSYWKLTWENGGSTIYMPTFNKNKDSLLADINGTFTGGYVKYALTTMEGTTSKEGHEVRDIDQDDDDELTEQALTDLIQNGTASGYYPLYKNDISVSDAVNHYAASTLVATSSISMEQWLAATNNGANPENVPACWVWDNDGWFYWSSPIAPGTATGKLLDQIQRTNTVIGENGETWYYGLNVVAQFITWDGLGNQTSKTGFYDTSNGAKVPSANALTLLNAIGVQDGGATAAMDGENAEVTTEADLRAAMENGGEIVLNGNISLSGTVLVKKNTYVNLNGCTITPGAGFSGQTLFTVSDGAWLSFDGPGTVQAPADGYAVCVESNGLLYIWGGSYAGGVGAVYAVSGEVLIVDGAFWLQNESGQLLSYAPGAKITVYGGAYRNFNPADVWGESLLVDGYTVETEPSGSDMIYTVTTTLAGSPSEEESPAPDGDAESSDAVESEQPSDVPAEGGNAETTPDSGSDGGVDGGASTDTPTDAAPSSSSAIESTGSGAVFGISGSAEPEPAPTPTPEVSGGDEVTGSDPAAPDAAESVPIE